MMCEGVLEMWGKFEISRGLTRHPPPFATTTPRIVEQG